MLELLVQLVESGFLFKNEIFLAPDFSGSGDKRLKKIVMSNELTIIQNIYHVDFLWIVDHFVESEFLFKNKNSFRTESLLPILLAQVARYEMEILILPNILFCFIVFILLDFLIQEFCFQGQKHKKIILS